MNELIKFGTLMGQSFYQSMSNVYSYLYPIYYNYQIRSASIELITDIIILILCSVYMYIGIKKLYPYLKKRIDNSDGDGYIVMQIINVGLLLLSVLTIVITIFDIQCQVITLLSPDYYVIQDMINQTSGFLQTK